ncbi:MnhB domain-containing protein [Thermobifida cellulosilytica]|uniref:MnhB domain-containing protein n=1 Tax=Thermobifida cellulosilytica TaxID=144786 RepID=UPI000839861C|nr:MnhB domain-containing protein [Thermobifida cellulosilytica]
MNNESIQRLREPAAWALLGAVAAIQLGALIYVFGGESGTGMGGVSGAFVDIRDAVLGPGTVAMVLAAVALILTGPNRSPRAFGIVMMAMIELGVGALLGVISLIMGFVVYGGYGFLASAFQHFFTTGAFLTVVVFAGLFLLRVFNDPTLVPRASAAQAYPTGAQPSFAQQQPGYLTGAQPSAQTGAWQQQGDSYTQAQPATAQTGAWQQQGDAYTQAQPATAQSGGQQAAGYDQSAYGQQYQQQGYDQAAYSQSGGQQAAGYDQSAYGQQYQQQGYDQAAYSQSGGQQAAGYDQSAYGQQYQQQGYDQAGYSQSGGQQAAGYDQSAYGQQYQQQGYDQAAYSQSGGQQAAGYDQSAYGQQYQQPGYTAGDSEATLVQPAVSDDASGSYPLPRDADAVAEERAAQEAIQHGWSQPAAGATDSQSGGNQPYDHGQYRTGGYPAQPYDPSSGGYPADQQRPGSEAGDSWPGQYRDDNRA